MKTSFKAIIKQIVPPIITDICSGFTRHHIWKGVYKNYNDVPVSGEGHDSPAWVKKARANVEILLANLKKCGTIPTSVIGEQGLLPLLASTICNYKGKVKILDFGGGMGIDYVYLINSLSRCQQIDYYIIESEKICDEGKSLFKNDNRIHFYNSIPADLSGIDVVHIDTALQYIQDYGGVLKKLCGYKPKYFLFIRLAASDIPTYATSQVNMPGINLACWFTDVKEIIEIMSANGYTLIFKDGSDQEYYQGNFPEENRMKMGRCSNLLFSRTGESS